MSSCCSTDNNHGKQKPDLLLWGSIAVLLVGLAVHFTGMDIVYLSTFAHAVATLLSMMWWGMLFGIFAVGVMSYVPREYFNALLGRGDSVGGLLRAAGAGLLLDLCSHGILMVGAKLYERGASLAQVMTFLIASPWNSLTLTFILIGLIGFKWTFIFIIGSAIIAVLTGYIYLQLTRRGVLPPNPNSFDLPQDFDIKTDIKARMKDFKFKPSFLPVVVKKGWGEGKMVIRWLFFGTVLAALIRAFVPTDIMVDYFGATMMGLMLTLLATTVIEVCSEGSTPIAADLVSRAGAPGNAFVFLMAGVATDYTEIMVIKEFTKRWAIALSLPLITVPQVLLLGWIMNQAAVGG